LPGLLLLLFLLRLALRILLLPLSRLLLLLPLLRLPLSFLLLPLPGLLLLLSLLRLPLRILLLLLPGLLLLLSLLCLPLSFLLLPLSGLLLLLLVLPRPFLRFLLCSLLSPSLGSLLLLQLFLQDFKILIQALYFLLLVSNVVAVSFGVSTAGNSPGGCK
jgi:hypothetical protein